jgi:hypothetical protein
MCKVADNRCVLLRSKFSASSTRSNAFTKIIIKCRNINRIFYRPPLKITPTRQLLFIFRFLGVGFIFFHGLSWNPGTGSISSYDWWVGQQRVSIFSTVSTMIIFDFCVRRAVFKATCFETNSVE